MVATEVKIAERKDEQKKRIEQIKLERDLERMRVEKNILFNYVRDHIVRGIILANVNRYIRNKTK